MRNMSCTCPANHDEDIQLAPEQGSKQACCGAPPHVHHRMSTIAAFAGMYGATHSSSRRRVAARQQLAGTACTCKSYRRAATALKQHPSASLCKTALQQLPAMRLRRRSHCSRLARQLPSCAAQSLPVPLPHCLQQVAHWQIQPLHCRPGEAAMTAQSCSSPRETCVQAHLMR